jgi:hypothetical protein
MSWHYKQHSIAEFSFVVAYFIYRNCPLDFGHSVTILASVEIFCRALLYFCV